MEDALEGMSHNLDQAFDETVLRIQRLPANRCRLGMSALMWTCFAMRPLSIPELSDALAIQLESTTLNTRYRPTTSMILECCQGLLILDPESNIIRPAHYTIQEYLLNHKGALFPIANAELAVHSIPFALGAPSEI